MKSTIVFLTIISLLFLLSNSVLASDRNLKGLSQVGLFIDFGFGFEKFDVNKHDIKLESELLFRKYGMKVLSKEELSEFEDSSVAIFLTHTAIDEGNMKFRVELQLREFAELMRNKDIIGHIPYNDVVTSWNTHLECYVYPQKDNVEEKIMDCLNDVNKTFINIWLKANQ